MASNAWTAAAWMSEGSRSGYRVIGIGPRSPCHGSAPNSASASTRRNAGRTSAKVQPGFPRAAQASKSAAAPRTANRVSHEVPPRSRPRRSLLGRARAARLGLEPPVRHDRQPPSVAPFRRRLGRTSGPASSRTTDRSPVSARRLATTQPAAPPPTTTMSNASVRGHRRPSPAGVRVLAGRASARYFGLPDPFGLICLGFFGVLAFLSIRYASETRAGRGILPSFRSGGSDVLTRRSPPPCERMSDRRSSASRRRDREERTWSRGGSDCRGARADARHQHSSRARRSPATASQGPSAATAPGRRPSRRGSAAPTSASVSAHRGRPYPVEFSSTRTLTTFVTRLVGIGLSAGNWMVPFPARYGVSSSPSAATTAPLAGNRL